MRRGWLLLAALAGAGCAERGARETDLAARREASRSACIAAQISQQSEEQAAMLGRPGSAPVNAAAAFAQAFDEHARLRQAALAQLDSALNQSPTPGDSARHARAAASFEINAPEPGSVEANVFADYQRRFRTLAADAGHPCNWQAEAVK